MNGEGAADFERGAVQEPCKHDFQSEPFDEFLRAGRNQPLDVALELHSK